MVNRLYVFLDESGNTGDALFDANQSYFVLGGFGSSKSQLSEISEAVEQLRREHNILPSSELKGAQLWPKRPKFVIKLMEYMYDNKIPLFIELINKKYLIIPYIIDYSILLPNRILLGLDEFTKIILRGFAELLYHCLSDETLVAYTQASKNPSKESFENFMSLLRRDIDNTCPDPLLKLLIDYAYSEYTKMVVANHSFSDIPPWEFFLPPAEEGGSRRIAILPHSTSISNILFRLEKYSTNNQFEKIHIVYDKNPQERILVNVLASTLNLKILPQIPMDEHFRRRYKYKLEREYTLSFGDSRICPYIQIADVIVSSLNKIWKEFKITGRVKPYAREVFKVIFDYGDLRGPSGVNFVIPESEYEALYRELFKEIQEKTRKTGITNKYQSVQEVMSDAESIHLPGREEVCGKGQGKSPSTRGNPLKKPRGTQ
ncbi:hypothetical protein JCM16138_11320 [Thermococcus atlanticus]